MTFIKNINGTSDNTCSCGSWIKHWENFTKEKAIFCSAKYCSNFAKVGAHVQMANSGDNRWYIVPLCDKCNKAEIKLDIGNTKLVSANKIETCG